MNKDIMLSTDQGKGAILALLELSAAFDDVDLDDLFVRLEKMFGLSLRFLSDYVPRACQFKVP